MNQKTLNPRLSILLLCILPVVLMRIANSAELTIWSNFTPIAAMGLFGGHYFKKNWQAFVFPVAALLASDVVINLVVFNGKYGIMYSGWYIIYIAFALIVLVGRFLMKKVTVPSVLLSAMGATLLHWGIADFAVWLGGGTDLRTMMPFAKDWSGLVQCYLQGVPFAKNFLLGTIVYSGILFGTIEWMKATKPQWVLEKPTV